MCVWQVLCHSFQPCTDALCTWNGVTSLCSSTQTAPLDLDLVKTWETATKNSPYQRPDKEQEACKLVSLRIPSLAANDFSVATRCKRTRMRYAVDKHSEKQPQRDSTLHICTELRTDPSLSPEPRWRRGRSHCSCGSGSHTSMLSTTENPREAGQQDKEMQPWCLFYLLGGEERCCCWLQMKTCFSASVLSGEFIVFTHHYQLVTCPGIHPLCFRKLRFSTVPAFLAVKTIWCPMGQLDLQCYSAVTSIPLWHFMEHWRDELSQLNKRKYWHVLGNEGKTRAFLQEAHLLDFEIPQLQRDWVGMTNWIYPFPQKKRTHLYFISH